MEADVKRYGRVDNPFLTIITMSYKRPSLLAQNRAILERQTCQDFEQIVLEDTVGRGWPWVARQYQEAAGLARGRYVMYVEDDDQLADIYTVGYLRDVIGLLDQGPDVIVALFGLIWRDGREVPVPEHEFWGKLPPQKGHISGQCIIARREVWQKHAAQFGPDGEDEYAIDIQFVRSILDETNAYHILWLPCLISKMQVRGLGRTEEEMSGIQTAAAGGR